MQWLLSVEKEKPMNKHISIQQYGESYVIIGDVDDEEKKPRIRIQNKNYGGPVGLNLDEIEKFVSLLQEVSKSIQEEANRL